MLVGTSRKARESTRIHRNTGRYDASAKGGRGWKIRNEECPEKVISDECRRSPYVDARGCHGSKIMLQLQNEG